MNVPEKLAREIRRVATLKQIYEEVGKLPNVMAGPAVFLMDEALERACKAAGCDDAFIQIAALQELEGFME